MFFIFRLKASTKDRCSCLMITFNTSNNHFNSFINELKRLFDVLLNFLWGFHRLKMKDSDPVVEWLSKTLPLYNKSCDWVYNLVRCLCLTTLTMNHFNVSMFFCPESCCHFQCYFLRMPLWRLCLIKQWTPIFCLDFTGLNPLIYRMKPEGLFW